MINDWTRGLTPLRSLDAEPITVVHFWARWNGYDKTCVERLTSIADLFDSSFPLRSVEIDQHENRHIASLAGVTNTLPAIALLVNGVFEELLLGLHKTEDLRRTLQEWRDSLPS